MTQKTVIGGGRGGQIVAINGEKYRFNPTKDITKTGALAGYGTAFAGRNADFERKAEKSKPKPETIH